MCTVLELLCVLFSVMALIFHLIHVALMNSLKMSYCYLAFRTNVLLNLCCPGHLSYYSPNESEPLITVDLMMTVVITEAVMIMLLIMMIATMTSDSAEDANDDDDKSDHNHDNDADYDNQF